MVLSGFETTCFRIWDIEIYVLVSVVAQRCATVAQLNCLNADDEGGLPAEWRSRSGSRQISELLLIAQVHSVQWSTLLPVASSTFAIERRLPPQQSTTNLLLCK